MTYEKDPFKFEDIPDFALQPARGADEYNNQFMPKGAIGNFDVSAYEKILHAPARQEHLKEETEGVQPVFQQEEFVQDTIFEPEEIKEELASVFQEDLAMNPLEESIPVTAPEPLEEIIPAAAPEPLEETIPVADPEPLDEAIPVAAPTPIKVFTPVDEPALKPFHTPAAAPVPQPVPIPKATPIKVVPVIGSLMSSKLKLMDIKNKPQVRVYIEEDILVPDVKPDLASVISMDGKIKLSEKEVHTGQAETDRIKVSGDLILQTLYIPETMSEGEPMVSIESRLPFRNDMDIKTGSYSDLMITPTIESIDYTVINERKFKVKATVALGLREYSNVDIEIFEGIRDEEVQMLKEKIHLTDVALRKTETVEIKEELNLKDNMPEIQKILKYDVNVTENHKQITKEKAVINASVYCNIMYLGQDTAASSGKSDDADKAYETIPVLYQGKTEFTQFIRLDGDNSPAGQNPAGSRINFDISSLNLTAKEDGNGKKNIFELDMNVETELELYKNIEKEVVTDVYHHLKDIQFETDDIGLMALSGSGVAEISVREIINIPERYGNVDRIAYISGKINEKSTTIEQGKSIVEGNVLFNLICISADDKKTIFSIKQEIPFRSAMEIPGITSEMTADNDMMLKELWFDKINNRQIEVNAGILVNTAISSQEKHQLVRSVSFLESPQDNHRSPGIILYITKAGDSIWKIAKRYRTTIDEIKKVNDLDYGKEIKPGTKLLIVAKNH